MEFGVRLTVVGSQMEAEMICSLLRSNGINCAERGADAFTRVRAVFRAGSDRRIGRHVVLATTYRRHPENTPWLAGAGRDSRPPAAARPAAARAVTRCRHRRRGDCPRQGPPSRRIARHPSWKSGAFPPRSEDGLCLDAGRDVSGARAEARPASTVRRRRLLIARLPPLGGVAGRGDVEVAVLRM